MCACVHPQHAAKECCAHQPKASSRLPLIFQNLILLSRAPSGRLQYRMSTPSRNDGSPRNLLSCIGQLGCALLAHVMPAAGTVGAPAGRRSCGRPEAEPSGSVSERGKQVYPL